MLIEDFCCSTGLERGLSRRSFGEAGSKAPSFEERGRVVGLVDEVVSTDEQLRSAGLVVSSSYAPDGLRSREDHDPDTHEDGTAGPTWTMSWE